MASLLSCIFKPSGVFIFFPGLIILYLFFVVLGKINGVERERDFVFYLTAVRDITEALEAFCVSLNQLIRPLVS